MNSTSTQVILAGLEGNEPTRLVGLQVWLQPHVEVLLFIWWCVFFATLSVVAWHAIQAWRD